MAAVTDVRRPAGVELVKAPPADAAFGASARHTVRGRRFFPTLPGTVAQAERTVLPDRSSDSPGGWGVVGRPVSPAAYPADKTPSAFSSRKGAPVLDGREAGVARLAAPPLCLRQVPVAGVRFVFLPSPP